MTTAVAHNARYGRAAEIGQAGITLLAAGIFAVRTVRTALGGGGEAIPALGGTLVGLTATLIAVAAAYLALRWPRRAAIPLGVLLLAELTFLGLFVAPPRLLAAIPLMFALGLALVRPPGGSGPITSGGAGRAASSVAAFVLLVPVGFFYLTTGLVAPFPDLLGAYALFGLFVGGAVYLAKRASVWVLAVPFAAAGAWFVMLWLGERLLGWSG